MGYRVHVERAGLIRDHEWLLKPDALFDAAKGASLDREWERAEALGRLALARVMVERESQVAS